MTEKDENLEKEGAMIPEKEGIAEEKKTEKKATKKKTSKKRAEEEIPAGDGSSLLVANDVYLKSGIHIGTKFKTEYMKKFIYKTRPDGLSVLNVQEIDNRIRIAANLLAQYEPHEILLVSRRENGWRPVRKAARAMGCKYFSGRYPPGMMTNTSLPNYMEVKIVMVTDPWVDRNVIGDAIKVGIPVISLCDTNNSSNNIDLVVPCNNKGKKSLGLLFWLLANEYLHKKGLLNEVQTIKESVEDFTEE